MKFILIALALFTQALLATPFDDVLAKLSPADRRVVEEALNDVRREAAAQLQAKDLEKSKADAAAVEKLAVAEKLKAAWENGDQAKFDEAAADLEKAKQPEKDKRLAELDEQIAKLNAEKAELEAKAIEAAAGLK